MRNCEVFLELRTRFPDRPIDGKMSGLAIAWCAKGISGNWCKRCSWTIRYFFSATSRVRLFGPLNLPPLEAFALGCPVIAADIPGAKQELGDAAMLVNPANEFEIAEALKSVHSDSAKREA